MSEAPAAVDTEKLQAAFKDIAERSQKLLQDFAERYKADGQQPADPLHLTQTFMDLTAKMMADPNRRLFWTSRNARISTTRLDPRLRPVQYRV